MYVHMHGLSGDYDDTLFSSKLFSTDAVLSKIHFA